MASIRIDNLTKMFDDGDLVAVDDLNLAIDDGEFVVIVGPSGCGKSTTLNCIAGLETPTSGKIYFDDEDVTDMKPQHRNIAMVFQNYALYPHMNARKNMEFGLKMRSGWSKQEISERIDEVAELLEIGDLLDQRPSSLSGGQQQRVALGRAIARDPEVFLMDEPLSNLDAKLRTQMRAELQTLQAELDVTTIYVTHDQTEAMTMGDRIVIMMGGVLQQVGTPLECYNNPANQFVAGFLGSPSMNFIEVTRQSNTLRHDGFQYAVSQPLADRLASTTETVTVGIRPEDIEIFDNPRKNTIRAEILVVEPLGNNINVILDVAGEQFVVEIDADREVEVDETVHLSFPEEQLHVFDAKTGEAHPLSL